MIQPDIVISNTIEYLPVKKKANQKLNARMTESVCYVITSQLFCCARAMEGLVRAASVALGRGRARERERAESDKWGASDDRGQRAALTLELRLLPPSPAFILHPSSTRHACRAATLFMIASELKASSRFSTEVPQPNNKLVFPLTPFNFLWNQRFFQ